MWTSMILTMWNPVPTKSGFGKKEVIGGNRTPVDVVSQSAPAWSCKPGAARLLTEVAVRISTFTEEHDQPTLVWQGPWM